MDNKNVTFHVRAKSSLVQKNIIGQISLHKFGNDQRDDFDRKWKTKVKKVG